MQNKSFFTNCVLFLCAALLLLQMACTGKEKVKELPFVDFTGKVFQVAEDAVTIEEYKALQKEFGRFFEIWLHEILDFEKYQGANDSLKAKYLGLFLEQNKPVYKAILMHYKKYPNLQEDISTAFQKLQKMNGQIPGPVVYSYFSQFSNYTSFIDTSKGKTIIGYSAEMFMNDTFPLYKMLEVPEFMNRYNATNMIPSMLVWNYLKSVYEENTVGKKMIEEAIFNGKIWYTMSRVFENNKPWEIFGYTQQEWDQMMREEGQIWRHYISGNALFSTDFSLYKRYFIYGNHTFGGGIPPDCPPLIGNFTGYRIVSEYMEKNKISIPDLWKEKDAEKVLRLSGYNPIK